MTRPRIRLLALVQRPVGTAPNQRFRLEQWAPHLARAHGIDLTFESFASPELAHLLSRPGHRLRKSRLALRDTMRRRHVLQRLGQFDAAVVLREASLIGGAWLERAVVRAGIPLIYDFDDAIWLWDRFGMNGVMSLARVPWKIGQICELASAVTVGNDFLAAYAAQYNENVHIVRTSVELARFPVLRPPKDDEPFTVVWTGSSSTLAHLETARAMLEKLGARMPLRLRVICDVPPRPFENLELDFITWSSAREAAELGPGHVGIMPLPDEPFTHGKCGCKALQYMAVGRPVVVSPVGINRTIVQPGENGFWASTEEEWLAALQRLSSNAPLRRRMASAARETVEQSFTAEESAARFADVVRSVVARGSSRVRAPIDAADRVGVSGAGRRSAAGGRLHAV